MLKTFRIGGVHPPENKLSAGQAIITADLPKQAVVMLSQHIGAPAQAVVAKGDKVKVGTLLAQAGGFVSANIHSPVSGTVSKIDTAIDAAGFQRPAIIIDVEGDEWEESIDRSETLVKECTLDAKAIIDRIKECGIVGLGGATFPTHVKLSPPPGMTATILIINAVECEPYLTSDHQLMMEKGEEILVGVEILRKAINVERAVIGIENNKPDAIKHMTQLATDYPAIEICPLKVKYPQGGEKQLIDAVIRRQVPSGALPIAKCRYGICRIRGCAETQTARRTHRNDHRQISRQAVEPACTHRNSYKPAYRYVRWPAARYRKGYFGRPHDGKSRRIDRHGNDKRLLGHPHNTGSRVEAQRNATLYPLCQMRISLSYGTRAERIDECIKFPKLGTCRGRACHGLHRMRLLQFHLSRPPSAARLHTHGKSQSRCHHSQP